MGRPFLLIYWNLPHPWLSSPTCLLSRQNCKLINGYAFKINKRHGCRLAGFAELGELSSNANHTGAPAYRTSAPASPSVAIARTWYIGRIKTLMLPRPRSVSAFFTHAITPPVNGGFTQFRLPQSMVSPSNPSGRGYGHGSKSKLNSLFNSVIISGGVIQ